MYLQYTSNIIYVHVYVKRKLVDGVTEVSLYRWILCFDELFFFILFCFFDFLVIFLFFVCVCIIFKMLNLPLYGYMCKLPFKNRSDPFTEEKFNIK